MRQESQVVKEIEMHRIVCNETNVICLHDTYRAHNGYGFATAFAQYDLFALLASKPYLDSRIRRRIMRLGFEQECEIGEFSNNPPQDAPLVKIADFGFIESLKCWLRSNGVNGAMANFNIWIHK